MKAALLITLSLAITTCVTSFDFNSCGFVGSSYRISHGEEAPLMEHPWNVLIGYEDLQSDKIMYSCGGTLISGMIN
jgi:hypothetical protein